VVTGYRVGESAQLFGLAEALGWPFEVKRLAYNRVTGLVALLCRASLAGIEAAASSPLAPPWPDLVLSAGFRNEPVCRWIQHQADAAVRLVHIGRPWAPFDCFDLIITTPQYHLPDHPNVLQNRTPMHRVTPERLALEAARWAPHFAHLPRPYIAVVVGGRSGPFAFTRRSAQRLAEQADALAHALGGSLLVTTSARTPTAAVDMLAAGIQAPAHIFRWNPEHTDNPYFGYLGLADHFIVGGDSISMLAETCSTGKPVYIFDLGEGRMGMRPNPPPVNIHEYWQQFRDYFEWRSFLYRLVMKVGPSRLSRDITQVHDYLVSTGRATWLGEPAPPAPPPPLEDIPRAVARIRGLVGLLR
jgi:hypothetical protein